ncbi:MAG: hypothetical protein HYU66_24315 [Armatimonadetes bacterium]|nr:hypothetical protein [Armatimonadota bacterium]
MKLDRWPVARLAVVLVGGAVVCLAAGVGFSVRPAREILRVDAGLRQSYRQIEAGRAATAVLEAVRAEHQSLSSQVEALEATPLPELYLPTLLGQLDGLARGNGLELKGVSPDGRAAGHGPYHVKVALGGPFLGVMGFVHGLQTAPKAFDLEGLAATTEAGSTPARVTAELALVGFEVPGLTAAGGASVPSPAPAPAPGVAPPAPATTAPPVANVPALIPPPVAAKPGPSPTPEAASAPKVATPPPASGPVRSIPPPPGFRMPGREGGAGGAAPRGQPGVESQPGRQPGGPRGLGGPGGGFSLGGGFGGSRARTPEEQAKRLQEQLGLTDAQTAEVTAINKAYAPKFQELFTHPDPDQQAQREKMGQLFRERGEKVSAILTPEQKAKQAEQQQQRQGRGGFGGPGGGGPGRGDGQPR